MHLLRRRLLRLVLPRLLLLLLLPLLPPLSLFLLLPPPLLSELPGSPRELPLPLPLLPQPLLLPLLFLPLLLDRLLPPGLQLGLLLHLLLSELLRLPGSLLGLLLLFPLLLPLLLLLLLDPLPLLLLPLGLLLLPYQGLLPLQGLVLLERDLDAVGVQVAQHEHLDGLLTQLRQPPLVPLQRVLAVIVQVFVLVVRGNGLVCSLLERPHHVAGEVREVLLHRDGNRGVGGAGELHGGRGRRGGRGGGGAPLAPLASLAVALALARPASRSARGSGHPGRRVVAYLQRAVARVQRVHHQSGRHLLLVEEPLDQELEDVVRAVRGEARPELNGE
mmetsp:Transcript_9087/g.31280  ORF Transcript_9087/g.31280 Transcript_9087/m.31280 type:complete len:332 (-) Transcript_9087:1090-2085(-)